MPIRLPQPIKPGPPQSRNHQGSRGERVQDSRRNPGKPRRGGHPGLSDTRWPWGACGSTAVRPDAHLPFYFSVQFRKGHRGTRLPPSLGVAPGARSRPVALVGRGRGFRLQHPHIRLPQPSPQVSRGRGSQFPLSLASKAPACTPDLKMKPLKQPPSCDAGHVGSDGAPGRWGGGLGRHRLHEAATPPGTRGRVGGDSREHGEGDQGDGQAEHRQRAADVTDGRERHLVSACELCGKQSREVSRPAGAGWGLALRLVWPEPDGQSRLEGLQGS